MNTSYTLHLKGQLFSLESPKIMGIINATPDSYLLESRATQLNEVIAKAEKMIIEGVDIIDIGACSTRPGSIAPSPEEEWDRLKHILPELVKQFPNTPLSIDTYRSHVAERALDAGVALINDVSMGEWEGVDIMQIASKYSVPYVLTHSRGLPEHMQQNTDYEDFFAEIFKVLSEKIEYLKSLGINDIILDPGFGFGKNVDQNYQLLTNLSHLHEFKLPLLVGISRKSMIYKPLHSTAEEVLSATCALHFSALEKGAHLLRVHDVKEAKQVIRIFELYIKNLPLHAI